jgi:ankyrin repeat protein
MESPTGSRSVPLRGALRPLALPPVDVKVVLRNRDGDTESVSCTVVDAAKHLCRINNIPLLRERPTFGDVIVATPGRDGLLGFRRTHAAGGFRWGALEYAERTRLAPLVEWLEHTRGVKTEGFSAPDGEASGIVGLAIPRYVDPKELFARTEYAFPGVWRLGRRPTRDGSPQSYAGAVTEALHPTLFDRDVVRLRMLIAEGADVNAEDEHGQTPAFLAVCLEDAKLLTLLRDAGANLLARNTFGQTTLQFAVGDGLIEIVKMVLAAGSDPNDQANADRMTALHIASLRDKVVAARLLLRAGARVGLRDREDRTALMCAATNGNVDTGRVLLPYCTPRDRNDALVVAAKQGSLPMVKLLLSAGADPHHRSPDGTTALSLAWANKKATSIVKVLVKAAGEPKGTGNATSAEPAR